MVRKLLTKPTWWWETRRRYPVRHRYRELPPIPVVHGPHRFAVLTTPAALADAMWTAWSWYRFLYAHGFELQLAIDGALSNEQLNEVRALFPEISVCAVQSLLPEVSRLGPALATFFEQHPLGKKLGLVLALSQRGVLLFCDYDVLAFREPVELFEYGARGNAAYMREERAASVDQAIVDRSRQLGLEYDARFNSGLLYVPKGALAIDQAAQLLADWRPPVHWFTEQTVLNALMQHAHAQPLPQERYVVSARRQFYWETDEDYGKIVARHFVSPVRHVMYRYGIPLILSQSQKIASPAAR